MNNVVVYVSSVANYQRHPRKVECLESFAKGVFSTGHSIHVQYKMEYKPSRLAVILGWATTNTGGANILLRRKIIEEQARLGGHTMCIDASCWKYIDNHGTYLRYSLGGPFYDSAEYANKNSTDQKWNEISNRLGISLDSPRSNPNGHILICMQRDGGFAMKSLNPITWMQDKIQEIRKYTDRKIIIRPHPGAYKMQDFRSYFSSSDIALRQNAFVIDPSTLTLADNLNDAHSAVFFNSSSSVAAVCKGIPVFVDDVSCVSWDVANKDISQIETPQTFERTQWLYDLAAAHWSDDDAQSGRIYQKFLPFLA